MNTPDTTTFDTVRAELDYSLGRDGIGPDNNVPYALVMLDTGKTDESFIAMTVRAGGFPSDLGVYGFLRAAAVTLASGGEVKDGFTPVVRGAVKDALVEAGVAKAGVDESDWLVTLVDALVDIAMNR